ncbi:MAG TPA: MBL fold metallo-hydrolase [Devosiaceae bacterium]|jgi:phosphoribosyl 1,2-cyclic phosphate phosphodiesterase|nr:MBL fold metallo-hydrolase [Devosiaceae bacterium]
MAEAERIIATILGCGSSGGVPRIGNIWGICDPNNPRNRRRRCALLIEGHSAGSPEPTRIIIDTGCDLREQMLAAGVDRVEAVFYTHEHADHTHGIDDLRVLALNNRRRVDVHFTQEAGDRIREAFGYCFTSAPGSDYPPILEAHVIKAGQNITIDGPGGSITLHAFLQEHGSIHSLGYRVGGFAYSCDLSAVPKESRKSVSGLDFWVIDALRPLPHPSHLSLPESLAYIAEQQPKQAILTNLHIDMDYAGVEAQTPENVTPAFDGMRIDVTAGVILNR